MFGNIHKMLITYRFGWLYLFSLYFELYMKYTLIERCYYKVLFLTLGEQRLPTLLKILITQMM